MERAAEVDRVLPRGERREHQEIAVGDRFARPARRTKNPGRGRGELELRGDEAVGGDALHGQAIDGAEQVDDVVGRKFGGVTLFRLRGPETLEVRGFRVEQSHEQRLAGGNGDGALDRAEGRGEKPDLPGLACPDLKGRVIKEGVTRQGQLHGPFPPFGAPCAVALTVRMRLRWRDARIALVARGDERRALALGAAAQRR